MSFEKDNYCVVKDVLSKEMCVFLKEFGMSKYHEQKPYNSISQIDTISQMDIYCPGSYVITGDHVLRVVSETVKPKVEELVGNKLVSTKSKMNIYGRRDEVKKDYEYDGNSKYIVSILIGFNYDDSEYRWPMYLIDEFNKHELTQDVGNAVIYRNGGNFKYHRDPLMKPFTSHHIQLYLNYADDDKYF